MATDNESFNRDLNDLLKVRGYDPVPLDADNNRVPVPQLADVFQFTFTKDNKEYDKAWVTIDDAKNVIVYYDEEQQESPSGATPGVEYNDSWTGFLTHLKNWAQGKQLSFELANEDRLGDDMRQRKYYKMKERVSESYHSMGKKASYNDVIPEVKIVIQHNRALEEGEQRYRNVARIFLENADGERFLAPTTRPGIARVYARHIAEGGLPNDDRWNHIKSVCEDYSKMAGFVRATRNKEFNESALSLVQEGANHYSNLRETLSKLAGHRGYHAYFESWTPSLMEDEGDDISINELFVQETVDPRIESVMPILSKLRKNVAEMSEVDTLSEWADSIISEKLELEEGEVVPFKKKKQDDDDDDDDDDSWLDDDSWIPSIEDFEQEEAIRNRNREYQKRKRTPANDVNEMDKSPEANPYSGQGHSKSDDHAGKPQHTAKMMKAKDAIKAARKALDKAFKGDVEENFIGMAPQAVAEVDMGQADRTLRHTPRGADDSKMSHISSLNKAAKKMGHDSYMDVPDDAVEKLKALAKKIRGGDDVAEDLDANQERVDTLGPTEKVRNNNIGKLVGASESTEIDPALARILEMARFKR